MDSSTLITIAIGLIFGVIGWLLSNKDARQEKDITELKKDIVTLHEKNNITHQTLIGEYIKRSEFDAKIQRLETDISTKLDKILDKLERKADK